MNFIELQTALDQKISSSKVSGFWSEEMKKRWINDAIIRICNFKNWKFTELAKTANTLKDHEYYDYPSDFKINSIYYLTVDDEEYTKKSWQRYQQFKKAGGTKVFTSHNGFYFVSPTPDKDNLTIDVWGFRIPADLENAVDIPITPKGFDESIIKLALASCLEKQGNYKSALSERIDVESQKDGLLVKLAQREEEEDPQGYVGRTQSTRT